MRYRELGKTGLSVSEIGLGGEWLERHDAKEVKAVIDRCEDLGINILDCWMSQPQVRSNIKVQSWFHRNAHFLRQAMYDYLRQSQLSRFLPHSLRTSSFPADRPGI